jgi:lysophospholipase L1-like esterase
MKITSSKPRWMLAGVLVSAALWTARTEAATENEFFFRDGDRVMILGDSITEQRQYSTLIESFVLSRFPNWNITFRNTGVGGDRMGLTSRGGLNNGFARDINWLKPTAVTVDFGMNDARAGEKGYATYVENAAAMADKFAALGTRVAFLTPSPEERYEAGQPAGSAYNILLRKYSAGLKEVAAQKQTLFVDQLNPMIATIEAGRAAGVLSPTEGGARLIPDGVHPNPGGHRVMATYILKGLHAPALVSSVEIDAKSGEVKAQKARVTNVSSGETLKFTRRDDALPWPYLRSTPLPDANLSLKLPGFAPLEELSRYMLQIKNLTSASYTLSIDGTKAGTFTREQLAEGVNLTLQAGPITNQATQLLMAILHKNVIYFDRWRGVQLASVPKWLPQELVENVRQAELAKYDAQIADAEKAINALRVPQAHDWELTPNP